MIASWKHKGLKQFYLTESKAGIKPEHAKRLTIILQFLDSAEKAEDLDLPGFNFHKLKGPMKEYYSVQVSGNWRVIFKFEGENPISIDYLDYH
ncbi:MAG TPA: type II toxin-antitoxin system RelE/ParE family toxin [Bdellovibrionota bacterium]|nr:MAG: Killer protein [Gammaproteobacteria bacterium RIFCSPLOWO2_02_FULL_38_11]HLD73557.1 type II toxin-antitoxin system RelE/ParE family toxin [Bdellovibrionota bacterium]